MAEALAIFGSAASVIGILDVLGRATTTLLDVRARWKDADTSLLGFTAQLGVLRTALTKIKEWMENYVDETHHQLVMDLEASLQCCHVLAVRIEEELANLQILPNGKLSKSAKAKWLSKSGGLTEIQQMVDRQTSTLTLLLTACNSASLAEQQLVLTKPNTRKALKKIRKDSESLIVHRDKNSLVTGYTDNLSKLSRVFSFDGDLFASKVYQSVIRNRLKLSIRSRHSQLPQELEEVIKAPSTLLEKQTQVTNISFLGTMQSSKFTLLKQMRYLYGDFGDAVAWRDTVGSILQMIFKDAIASWRSNTLNEDEQCLRAVRLIQSEPEPDDLHMLPLQYLDAFKTLLADKTFQAAMLSRGDYYRPMRDYFLQDLDGLFMANYSPTFQDILHTRFPRTGITEYTVNVDSHAYRLFDPGGARSERKKWVHIFGLDIHVLIFVVAMSDYDQTLYEDDTVNLMKESLDLFKNIVQNKSSENRAIMLCFTKMDIFKKKVVSAERPVRDYFPEYAGEQTDTISAQNFFTEKFVELDLGNRVSSIHHLNITDSEDVKKLIDDLKDVVSRFWRQRKNQMAISTRAAQPAESA